MTESKPSGTSDDPTGGKRLQRIKHSTLLTRLLLGDVYSQGSQASIHTPGQYPGQTGVHIVLGLGSLEPIRTTRTSALQ